MSTSTDTDAQRANSLLTGHPELTSNKMAQIWNNLQLYNAKSIADVRASALEWYRTNLQN